MTTDTEDFTDTRIKHLGMIQDVVERMANASTWMKRMSIIVVGGAVAIAARAVPGPSAMTDQDIALVAILLVIIFWGMDSRYHQQERWFRRVYDVVRVESHTARPDFRITPNQAERESCSFIACVFTWSTWPFYVALTAFLVLIRGIQ